MKTGINAWSIRGEADFEEAFFKASEAGFDGIELNVDNGGAHALTLATTDAELDSIRALSEKYKLPVSSISTSLWGGKLGEGTADSLAYSERLMKKQLDCAKKLGANGILVVPGGMSRDVSLAKAYENSLSTLSELAPMAGEYGLFVGVENVWNNFFISPFDMARFVDELGEPYCAYFDLGNVLAFSRPEDWIEILGERIKMAHIKGFRLNGGFNTGGVWCDIADSGIDWSRARKALDEVGYTGFVSAEVSKCGKEQSYEDYYRATREQIDAIIK